MAQHICLLAVSHVALVHNNPGDQLTYLGCHSSFFFMITMLYTHGGNEHPFVALDLTVSLQIFTAEYGFGCGLLINCHDYLEVISLSSLIIKSFDKNHVLNFHFF